MESLLMTVLGAFLGFGAALLAEHVVRTRRKVKSIDNIVDELNSFLSALTQVWPTIESVPLDERRAALELLPQWLAHRVHLPIWDAILGTGDILEFRKKPYFDALLGMYARILELRSRVETYVAAGKGEPIEARLKDLESIYACGCDIREYLGEHPDLADICRQRDHSLPKDPTRRNVKS